METEKSNIDEQDQRPAFSLSVQEYISVMVYAILKATDLPKKSEIHRTENKLIYGLLGLRNLLGCSHATAQKIKNTKLNGCFYQTGRKIVFDEAKVLKALQCKGGAK